MAIISSFGKVIIEFGAIRQLGAELAALGYKRPLLVTDKGLAELGLIDKAMDALEDGQTGIPFGECPNHPIFAGVEAVTRAYKDNDCDVLVPMGGGSMIDTCKGACIMTGNPGSIGDYDRPNNKPVTGPTAPIVAIPTTAGTGSEVSRGAGIHPDVGRREIGVGGDFALPKAAICDPELTYSLPPRLTAGTGMDALVHCMEGFLSPNVNPVVDAIALDGIRRVVTYVERAVADGSDKEARWHMMLAATQGGMAISKGLGIAHTLSMTLSDTPVHHGAVVTVAMPAVLRFLDGKVGDKLDRLAEVMSVPKGSEVASAVEKLNDRIGIPNNFRGLGYEKNDIDEMVEFSTPHWFNLTSPVKPTADDFHKIIGELLV